MHNSKLEFEESVKLSKLHSFKQDGLTNYFCAMEHSLQSFHPSMNASTNPVLRKIRFSLSSDKRIKEILIQYCFLPAEIVNLLSIARETLKDWSSLEFELTRNIDEEIGSRTNGIPHYGILVRGLKDELNLDISDSEQSIGTKKFLNSLKTFLLSSSESCAAGAIYGLEHAAVPELTIVARLLNHYVHLSGKKKTLITLPARRSLEKNADGNYNLDVFFAIHLLDFEVGHKKGLANALKTQHAMLPLNLKELELGFEFVMNQMDEWWEDLAIYI